MSLSSAYCIRLVIGANLETESLRVLLRRKLRLLSELVREADVLAIFADFHPTAVDHRLARVLVRHVLAQLLGAREYLPAVFAREILRIKSV